MDELKDSTPSRRSLFHDPVRFLVLISWVVALSSYLVTPFVSPPVFFQLAVGDFIRTGGSLPVTDLWSVVGEGRMWQTPSWWSDVLLAALVEQYDLSALVYVKLVLYFLFVALLFAGAIRRSRDLFFGSIAATLACAGLLSAGPFELSFLSWISFALAFCWSGPTDLLRRTAFLFGIVVLANLSVYAVLAYCVGTCIRCLVDATPLQRALTSEILPAACALFVTPYFGANIITSLSQATAATLIQFPGARHFGVPLPYESALFLVLVAFVAPFVSLEVRSRAIVLLGATIAPFLSYDLLPQSSVVLLMLAATCWKSSAKRGRFAEGIERFRTFLAKFQPAGVVWLFLCVIIVNLVRFVREPDVTGAFPEHAVTYLREHHRDASIITEPVLGSYLSYRFMGTEGQPEARVLYDERIAFFDPELARLFVRERLTPEQWSKLVKRFNPTAVLCVSYDRICEHAANESWTKSYPELSIAFGDRGQIRTWEVQVKNNAE